MTPFKGDIQEAIIDTCRREGFECVAERHLDSDDTFGYATIPPAETEGMIRAVGGAEPEAIAAVCTNMTGAPYAETMEAEAGRPVYDSAAVERADARRRRCGPDRRLGRALLRRPGLAGAPRRSGVGKPP